MNSSRSHLVPVLREVESAADRSPAKGGAISTRTKNKNPVARHTQVPDNTKDDQIAPLGEVGSLT